MAQIQIIKPNTKIPFMANHKPVLYLELLLLVGFFVIYFAVGPNWGTSFKGGSSLTMHFTEDVSTEELRKVFVDDDRFTGVSVLSVGAPEDNRFIVRTLTTTTLTCEKLDKIKSALPASIKTISSKDAYIDAWPACDPNDEGIRGDFFMTLKLDGQELGPQGQAPVEVAQIQEAFAQNDLETVVAYDDVSQRYIVKPDGIQSEVVSLLNTVFGDRFDAETGLDEIVTVGADVGEKFRYDAIISILVALGLMLLYIAIRFDARYAPAAVFSLTVSTLLTTGVLILIDMEITLVSVAALLSLVGYGINDTIVNFDRIREALASAPSDETLAQTVNRAVNECLSRTLMTSITTLLAIIPLILLAGGETRDFAIIMAIGIVFSTINTIFISCPGVLYLDKWIKNYQSRKAAKQEMDKELQATA
ncbi:MAG: protein translocase subunit SecF [Bradymonadales bacterium]|jgi:preprotein translocase subunit SecF